MTLTGAFFLLCKLLIIHRFFELTVSQAKEIIVTSYSLQFNVRNLTSFWVNAREKNICLWFTMDRKAAQIIFAVVTSEESVLLASLPAPVLAHMKVPVRK